MKKLFWLIRRTPFNLLAKNGFKLGAFLKKKRKKKMSRAICIIANWAWDWEMRVDSTYKDSPFQKMMDKANKDVEDGNIS